MSHITEKEIRHLAQLANLKLNEGEIQQLIPEIEAVLDYAAFLQEIAKQHDDTVIKSNCDSNILRDDTVIRYESVSLLDQAPETDGNYFVVPQIITTGE